MDQDHGHASATAFVGCGNLGMAILRGALAAGVLSPGEVTVAERDAARRAEAQSLGVQATADAAAAARGASLVVLAVKPQSFADAARELSPVAAGACVVSVMAGWSSEAIRSALGGSVRVVRAMPNIAAAVGRSMTALAPGAGASEGDVARAAGLFRSIGAVAEIREDQVDAAVAAVGSSPAYLFLLAEAQVAAAQRMGFPPEVARTMAVESLLGAATMLAADGRTPQALRAAVTSAGGTTAAAMHVFEARGFVPAVIEAMDAARARSAELGR